MQFDSGLILGKKVIEVEWLIKFFGDKLILKGLDIMIQCGDCVVFVGLNGVGKIIVIKMLLGQEVFDMGWVKLGINFEVVVFDQICVQFDLDMSFWDSLIGDLFMWVGGRVDQVMVWGMFKYVVVYFKDFLFDDVQVCVLVWLLLGGEKVWLLLVKLMVKEFNFLVFDELMNDFDIEMFDLLQELLDNYDGIVLLVSYDCDFFDCVVIMIIVMEGNGFVMVYVGGWIDYLFQCGEDEEKL